MSNFKANGFVDITDVVCPMTFVKAKVAIEELEEGQILEIKMNEGEPILNVLEASRRRGIKCLML